MRIKKERKGTENKENVMSTYRELIKESIENKRENKERE